MQKPGYLFLICLLGFVKLQAQIANFTADIIAACTPFAVAFKDQSVGNNIVKWAWDFGDGRTSTFQNPALTYFTPGSFNITLTVTDINGKSNTMSRSAYITAYGAPVIDFKGIDSVGCAPLNPQFTDLSIPGYGTTNISWFWDFADGTTSAARNPLHLFARPGSFAVSLKVTNDKGCSDVKTKPGYIVVKEGITADFANTMPATCSVPFAIGFTATASSTPPLSYAWDFGDGTGATGANTTHSYTTAGVYTPTLTVTNGNGCALTIKKSTPLNLQNTVSNFSFTDNACMGSNIFFQNKSTPTPVASSWEFSDGTRLNTSNPTKSFAAPGTYTVKLVNTFSFCNDSVVKNIQILPNAIAAFSSVDTTACTVPFTSAFTNNSTGAVSYLWDFGDGATSTAANPSHTYSSLGSYTVKLIATSASGCSDTLVKKNFVRIHKPEISLSGLPVKGCIPYTITPTATVNSLFEVTAYEWNFGDGTTSADAAPSHTYTAQGAYTVTLTVTTKFGCKSTYTLTDAVLVGRKPVVDFKGVPNPVCASKPVTFTDLSTENPVSWRWEFGDGTTGTLQNPVHKYADTGELNVKLIVTTAFGCTDSIYKTGYVKILPPVASFIPLSDCGNKRFFTFQNRSIVNDALNPLSWYWDLGDGSTSTDRNITHSYARYGEYKVLLVVTNGGCTDSSTKSIKAVNESNQLSATPTTLCKGDAVSFTASSTNAANIKSFRWDFGNGQTAADSLSQKITYSTAGSFTALLIATDINDCSDTLTKQITVTGADANFAISKPAGCKSLITKVTDSSAASSGSRLVKWQWDMGDNTTFTHTDNSPIDYTYKGIGVYTVKLKVTNEAGCTSTKSQVTNTNPLSPYVNFVSPDTLSCPQSTVHFTNLSTGDGLMSTWDFGNGITSTDAGNTQVRYTDTGRYTVKLIVKDAGNCVDSLTRTAYIRLDKPVASFTMSDSASYCTPFEVHFKNTSHYYSSVEWDLNGSSNTLEAPVQYYTLPGNYFEKLIVKSPGGCVDSVVKKVEVYNVPKPVISYSPLSGCKPLGVDLISTTPTKQSYVWDYGDGSVEKTDSNQVTHVYRTLGNFIPKAIIKNVYGCIVAVTGPDTIRIVGATTRYGIDKKILCDSGYVQFLDSTLSNDQITNYHWNFGDGKELNTSLRQSPVHYYAAPGVYRTTIDVITKQGCVDTFRLDIPVKVAASPVIRIGGDSVLCVNQTANHYGLLDRSDTASLKWMWQLLNGASTSLQSQLRFQYKTSGTFTISTIATNSSGCSDTATKTVTVNPLPALNLPGTITTQIGFPVKIDAQYGDKAVKYVWTPSTGLSCANCAQPTANPKFNTTYTVTVTDVNGCKNTEQVQVIVFCKNSNVFLPNTFSPNGDGMNDVFYVRGRGLDRVKMLRIFNRWGEVVFEKSNLQLNDISAGWDGTYKGAKAQPDVYVYQVDVFCDNSDTIRFSGNVALIQ